MDGNDIKRTKFLYLTKLNFYIYCCDIRIYKKNLIKILEGKKNQNMFWIFSNISNVYKFIFFYVFILK